jgi:3-oxoacyl-[acyl-carrier-protein] synthase II
VASERRRVVVTGLGIVSPLGNSVEASWEALLAGRSGAGPISRFDASDLSTRFACEVKDLDVGTFVDQKMARRMDRCTHLVLAAARQAESDSRLDMASVAERVGTAIV